MMIPLSLDRRNPLKPLAGVLLCVALGAGSAAFAQGSTNSQEMSLEELEAYIAEQKAALETVIENRDLTREKVEAIEDAVAEADVRQSEVRAEIAALCEERESAEPGSLETCLAENGG